MEVQQWCTLNSSSDWITRTSKWMKSDCYCSFIHVFQLYLPGSQFPVSPSLFNVSPKTTVVGDETSNFLMQVSFKSNCKTVSNTNSYEFVVQPHITHELRKTSFVKLCCRAEIIPHTKHFLWRRKQFWPELPINLRDIFITDYVLLIEKPQNKMQIFVLRL